MSDTQDNPLYAQQCNYWNPSEYFPHGWAPFLGRPWHDGDPVGPPWLPHYPAGDPTAWCMQPRTPWGIGQQPPWPGIPEPIPPGPPGITQGSSATWAYLEATIPETVAEWRAGAKEAQQPGYVPPPRPRPPPRRPGWYPVSGPVVVHDPNACIAAGVAPPPTPTP
jgi:hypothetical protein